MDNHTKFGHSKSNNLSILKGSDICPSKAGQGSRSIHYLWYYLVHRHINTYV